MKLNICALILLLILSSCSMDKSAGTDDKDTKNQTSAKDKKDVKGKKAGKGRKDGKRWKKKDGSKDKEDEEEVIINIEATKVIIGDAISVFRTTTILEADLESAVTAKASGVVLKINNEVGDKVKAGDILAILESDVQRLRVESANANYQKSLHNYERAKVLLRKGLANKESVENLKYETQALNTSLKQAKLDLDFTKVRAPISGIITKRNIKKGNLIQLNTQVYEIVDFDSLQAVINVPEDKWRLFKRGLDVNFSFNSLSEVVKGNILRVDPVVDSSTGTFKVVMEIAKDQQLNNHLRPGLFGKTQIVLDRHVNTLLVSKNAVIREDENAYVYEVNDDNTITKKVITIGYEMDDDLEILSGIQADKRVVTTGKNNVSEESTVEVIQYND